jgi:hypothetical protein
MADNRKPKGPPLRSLKLEVSEPKKTDLGWYFIAVAIVTRGKFPDTNAEVQFYFNKVEEEQPQVTDDEGRASVQFFETPLGVNVVEAQIKGEPLTKRSTKIVVREEKKEEKPPLRVSRVNVTESDLGKGKRLLTFETLTADHVRVPRAKLRIQEREIPDGCMNVETDNTGTVCVELTVKKTSRKLHVIPLGEPARSFTWTLYSKTHPKPKTAKNPTVKEASNG